MKVSPYGSTGQPYSILYMFLFPKPSKPKTDQADIKPEDMRAYIQQDLKKLSAYRSARDDGRDEQLAEDEDLPPLLQAISQTARADARREELQKELKKIEKQRALEEKEEQ